MIDGFLIVTIGCVIVRNALANINFALVSNLVFVIMLLLLILTRFLVVSLFGFGTLFVIVCVGIEILVQVKMVISDS